MKPIPAPLAGLSTGLVALLATAVLLVAACGGGGGTDVAGVGSGGSGVASGSVSGFGSVIVDGVEYDDTNATRQAEDASGVGVNAAVKLGHSVRLVYSGANVAQSIEVQAQLIGPVSAAPGADGALSVMGQRVRIVTSSNDVTQSSLTVLDGYASPSAVQAGDEVEVHGLWAYDNSLAASVLVATRLEKRAVATDPVQLGGVVFSIDGNTLRLNSAAGTLVQATSLSGVAVGDVLRVWVARSALGSSPLLASRVAGSGVSAADLASHASVSVSGLASRYDAASRTVEVQGMRVKLADGVVADEAALARGEFVTLQLSRSGSSVVASAVRQRSGSGATDLGKTVEVKGVTRGIDWTAASVSFTLRNTPIQASAAVIAASCRAVSLATNVYVEVRGTLAQSGSLVSASEVKCNSSYAGRATADYRGTISAIDTRARTLSLLVGATTLATRWDERTYFEQLPASLPVGLRVEVEGVMDQGSSTLRLTRVQKHE